MNISNESTEKMDEKAGKYLTFCIHKEIYGIEILRVQEIIGIMGITEIPNTPEYVRGIINLREKVIPVVDLRVKFNLAAKDEEHNCIILIQVERKGKKVLMGMVVDEVSEVMDISTDQLDSSPTFGKGVDTNFIMGIGKVEEKTIVLLDVDIVFNSDQIIQVHEEVTSMAA